MDDGEKADILNTYFANIGENLAKQLPKPTDLITEDPEKPHVPVLLRVCLRESDIKRKIESLKSNKSTGPDGISPKLIKLAGPAISSPLTNLFALSANTGIVFNTWKTARITPIHKQDDETEQENYRPISILSVRSKIMGSCVADALTAHVQEDNSLITDKQWACCQKQNKKVHLEAIQSTF